MPDYLPRLTTNSLDRASGRSPSPRLERAVRNEVDLVHGRAVVQAARTQAVEYVAHSALRAIEGLTEMASRLEDGMLTDVPVLLTDSGFRRRVLAKTTDPLTLAPWAAWFDQLSELERSRVVMPILNKTRAFTARDPIRRLLGQAVPSVRLDELYDKPLVVLVNLNTGVLGPETTRLIGSLILGQLRETVQRQAAVPQHKRRAVSVVVDEWQTFTAGMDFGDMLATARGMTTGFTLAHQHLAQLTPALRAAVLANTRSRVAFRPAKADAKDLAGVLGGSVTADELMRLPAYVAAAQVLVNGATSDPFLVQTPPLPDTSASPRSKRPLTRTSAPSGYVTTSRLQYAANSIRHYSANKLP